MYGYVRYSCSTAASHIYMCFTRGIIISAIILNAGISAFLKAKDRVEPGYHVCFSICSTKLSGIVVYALTC